MKPTTGRIVLYRLDQKNVDEITRRRTTGGAIADRIKDQRWPVGAQAHIGNPVAVGDIVPLVVVRVWPDEYGPGVPGINGQALLDGCDVLWVTSVGEGDGDGQWSWPRQEE